MNREAIVEEHRRWVAQRAALEAMEVSQPPSLQQQIHELELSIAYMRGRIDCMLDFTKEPS